MRSERGPANEVFISRAGTDAEISERIAMILRDIGYDVILQQWNFPNRNFIERMHDALARGARVVALLSPEYLQSKYCKAEWMNAIAGDPLNETGRLVVVRIAQCEPPGLLAGLAYWDAVPVRDDPRALAEMIRSAIGKETRGAARHRDPLSGPARISVLGEGIMPVPSFTGRVEELVAVACGLDEAGVVAIEGLGGVGKSALAREYAARNVRQYSFIWRINAETEDDIVQSLLQLGALFSEQQTVVVDRKAVARDVLTNQLAGFRDPMLFVYDNVEDENLLRTWWPAVPAHLLVTSRNTAWSSDVARVHLESWTVEEATAYIRRESGRSDLSVTDVRTIVDALGGLPLAVAHAAAYLKRMPLVNTADYLRRIDHHLANAPRGAEYPRAVFATFKQAIAQAESDTPGALALVLFAAFLAPSGIPEALFRESADLPRVLEIMPNVSQRVVAAMALFQDRDAVDEALSTLHRFSVLSFEAETRTFTMHRLVQQAARDSAGDDRSIWLSVVILALLKELPSADFSEWAACERLLPHIRVALKAWPDAQPNNAVALLATWSATYLRKRAAYAEARDLLEQAGRVVDNAGAIAVLVKARVLNELGLLMERVGRYDEAESFSRASLELEEAHFGRDSIDTAGALQNLAHILQVQGKFEESERLYRRALDIIEPELEPTDQLLNTVITNLGLLLKTVGRVSEARSYYERALAVDEATLGPAHPDIAVHLINLGQLAEAAERNDEAETFYRRAVAIDEAAYGPAHPEVATDLDHLSHLLLEMGCMDEAEALARRAFDIDYATFGGRHHRIVNEAVRIAIVCANRAEWDEAERWSGTALEAGEHVWGARHPRVAELLRFLARSFQMNGKEAEALAALDRARSIGSGES